MPSAVARTSTASSTLPAPGSPEPGSPRRLLWRAIRARRRDLVACAVLFSTHQIGESLVPVIVGAAIGRAVEGPDARTMALWLGLLAADFALLSFSYRFGARAATRARQHAAHRLRMWLTERVVATTGDARMPPGELLSRASSDAGRVGAFASQFAYAIAAVVVLLTSTVLLLRVSVVLGLIIVLGTIAQLVAQQRVWHLLERRSLVEQEEQARAAVLAEDLVRGLRVLKGIGAGGAATERYAGVSQEAARAALHATSSEASLSSVAALFAGGYLALIAGVGGWLALDGQLGLGELVAALGLARFVIGPMETVSGAAATYARALASARRVQEVLAAPLDSSPRAGTADVEGAAAVDPPPRAVTPGARDSGVLELRDVVVGRSSRLTVSASPGELFGLVCSDPVDAASVAALLGGERTLTAGTARLDGAALASLAPEHLRSRMLVCPHDAVLLPGTIADNVRVRAVGEDAVASAIHASFTDQVVQTVPDGLDTSVGDRGERLSGGQRQRVALARALAADPPVLVLHDPTTGVDAATEIGIAERVQQLRAARTTLVLTSSPAWLSRCDRVVLWDPMGSAQGTHADLTRASAAYRTAVSR
ncbi:putative ABC transport system integral membrane component [Nostocoides japonicum T1-X7]|uniref:Putative ABC transport system integral membrane component n=1 Tax=Nostocoides japonicum T1-X7 TaxID=1194083 RepID=A0A077LTX7_9MICO|nr:ABC transporter ATP-binding protein [Tetrasphaera japonica]CCH76851.1 putative ABC transport system integral membrane component [Tetrasphaera japonica T1-X7]